MTKTCLEQSVYETVYDINCANCNIAEIMHSAFSNFRVQISSKRNSSQFSTLHKKWSFPLRISSVNVTNQQFPADLVTFSEEMLNGKLHILSNATKESNALPVSSVNLFIKDLLGLQHISHFLLRKFIKTASVLDGTFPGFIILKGISSLMKSIIPTLLEFLSHLNGFAKPEIRKCSKGKRLICFYLWQ